MASNLVLVMSDLVESQQRERHWFRHIVFWFNFHFISTLFKVRKLASLPFVAVRTKLPTLNSIISEKDNSKIFNYFLNEILLHALSISRK